MRFDYFEVMARTKKKYVRAMEPVCRQWDLTKNELDVILFLANNPEFDRAADVVTHRGMTKSHVSLSVANLENRGILIRQTDPEDRRTIRLKLTDPGFEIAAEGRSVQEAFFRQLFQGISREDSEFWMKMLEQVCRNVDSIPE